MTTIYDLVRPGWNAGYVIAIGLTSSCLIASPATAQRVPDAYRSRIERSPYDSARDTPYSNRSQRRIREAKRIVKEVRRDRDDSFFHFKPVERDDDSYYSHDDDYDDDDN